MTLLWPGGLPIRVRCDAQGRPLDLRWNGTSRRVARWGRRWELRTDWWEEGGELWRSYFSLVTQDGLRCDIFHDHLSRSWCLERLFD